MRVLQKIFIGNHLANISDASERIKFILSFRFAWIYTLVTLSSFPFTIIFKRYDILLLMVGLLILNTSSLFLLKYTANYKISVILLSISSLFSAVGNSALASYSLSVILFLWPMIFAVFINYMLGNKATFYYITTFSILVTGISVVRIMELVPINAIDEMRINYSTGFMMFFASAFLLFFLSIYDKSRNEAISTKLSSLEERDNILHLVAHDLRNAVSTHIGCITLLDISLKENDQAECNTLLQHMSQNAQETLAIVNDLLDSAAMNASSNQINTQKVDMAFLTQELVHQYQPLALTKKILIEFKSNHWDYSAEIDPDKIQRALGNLLTNAIKFSYPNSTIQIQLKASLSNIILSIKDQGMGIPPEFIPELFKKYSKIGRKGTNGESTTGLGMYIVKTILDAHKATIQVKSAPHEGTEFTIEIPRSIA